MGGIFISYRRQDAPGYAGRLYDSLAAHFGEGTIFMDIGAIQPGQDFAERINDALNSCDVLLAVIGPQWCTVTDANGSRRLDDPDDFVGLELRTALLRRDVVVIPVLVGGGRMPAREEVPPTLAELRRRQALELSEERWRYDVQRLIATLEGPLPAEPAPLPSTTAAKDSAQTQTEPVPAQPSPAIPLVAVALGLLVAAGPAYAAYKAGLNVKRGTDVKTVAHFAAGWTGFWAVLSAVVSAVVAAMGPDRHEVVPRAARGLLLGALAGALGGIVNGVLRVNGGNVRPGIILGFAVTGAVFGLSRIAGKSLAVGFVGGAAAGALGGLIVAGNMAGFMSQALPAALILMGIALLQSFSTVPVEQPVAALTPLQRLQRH
jgi:hypothetical protein